MWDSNGNPDAAIRTAAFDHVRRLIQIYPHLTSAELAPGFEFRGERVPLVNPQRGIFKPRRMRHLLSIRTVFPRPGSRVWYDDQTQVHRQIFEGDETVDYAFMGRDPAAADNRWLREAWEHRVPIIYFLGIAPGRYHAELPVNIVDWNAKTLKAQIAFTSTASKPLYGLSEASAIEIDLERRYALRAVKQRLHQKSFREAVLTAYDGRCALSRLPEQRLLDAAHIIDDQDETLGQPIVSNGIPLSKIHHAAFDSHLIGIDSDYRVHVSNRLLTLDDGPMLESLKRLNGIALHRPSRPKDWPDRDRLAKRFELFKVVS